MSALVPLFAFMLDTIQHQLLLISRTTVEIEPDIGHCQPESSPLFAATNTLLYITYNLPYYFFWLLTFYSLKI